jgi:predicted RNase H-like nuclease (RuvC/YqgF family)
MAEVKRRGEFAKQRQELEILRSKERHLETHINQLEEHISKVVADYESKLQSSGRTVCSNDYSNSEEIKAMRKQVRELEKKLEVSSAAMKQLGKSSLLMEKENARLKSDKNELKSKLKKLVDCAEKFGPK